MQTYVKFLAKTKEEEPERTMAPMSMDEFYARIERSLRDFENGRVISSDALMAEFKQWQ